MAHLLIPALKGHRALKGLRDHKVLLVRKVPKVQLVRLAFKGRKELRERPARKVRRAFRVIQGQLVHRAPKASKVQPGLSVRKGHKVSRARLGLRVLQVLRVLKAQPVQTVRMGRMVPMALTVCKDHKVIEVMTVQALTFLAHTLPSSTYKQTIQPAHLVTPTLLVATYTFGHRTIQPGLMLAILKGHKEPKGRRVRKALLAFKELPVQMVSMVLMARKGSRAFKV